MLFVREDRRVSSAGRAVEAEGLLREEDLGPLPCLREDPGERRPQRQEPVTGLHEPVSDRLAGLVHLRGTPEFRHVPPVHPRIEGGANSCTYRPLEARDHEAPSLDGQPTSSGPNTGEGQGRNTPEVESDSSCVLYLFPNN